MGKVLVPYHSAGGNTARMKDACRLLGRRLAGWVAVVADGRADRHPLAEPESRTLPG